MDFNQDPRSEDPRSDQAPDGGRVEHDFERPLTRVSARSVRRLPAALPLAVAGILVVASVAFGATVVKHVVSPDPTPVIVGGDDDPTPTPTIEPTATPTATPTTATPTPTPTPGEPEATPTAPAAGVLPLTLTVTTTAGKAQLSWSAYTGDDFAYYKVVRSTDADAEWPLAGGDTLAIAIDNKATVTYLDCPGAGTFTYRVFAVKSADQGYAVLAASNNKTVTIPAPTKAPTVADPASLGTLNVHDNGDGTYTFSWTKYSGSTQFSYYKLSGVTYPETPGYAEGHGYWSYVDPSHNSVTVDGKAGTWNFNVEAIYYPSGKTTALARTTVLKVTMTAKSLPTAPPQVSMSATATLQTDNTVKITWSKYSGDWFSYYGIQRTKDGPDPAPVMGATPWWYTSNQSQTTYTDKAVSAGHTYKYIVFAFSDQEFAGSSAVVMPNCNVMYILAMSPVITVTIPAATPTPATPAPATPTPETPAPATPTPATPTPTPAS